MKIYTYHDDLKNDFHKRQHELIKLWKLSWSNQGFEPIVLRESDAKKHPFYNDFLYEIKKISEVITRKKTSKFGLSCWLRWLAYASQENEKFYVSDYDYININFKPCEPEDQTHLMVWHCPCFASGSAVQFEKLCHDFISVSNERMHELRKKANHYHDQDFFQYNFSTNHNKKGVELKKKLGIKVSTSPHKHCSTYDPISKKISDAYSSWLNEKEDSELYQTAHFSHSHTVEIAKKYPTLFKDWNFEDVRVNIIKKSLNIE